jgi:hypothetical protein
MKYVFTGVPGEEHRSLLMYGTDMPLGEPVEVSDVAAKKLANHPHFEAVAEAEEAASEQEGDTPKRKPGRPRKDA